MDTILKDETLNKAFKEVDKEISNAEMRSFRDYVEKNKFILSELDNLPSFRQKLWVSYLLKNITEYKAFLSVYENSKQDISAIIAQAKAETTKWHDVIETFNRRFSVPFIVEVGNQDEVILNEEAPSLKFKFHQSEIDPIVPIDEKPLWGILSRGEQRALYILNIIFEVKARAESGQETLFIVDDIADSFDYQNKYAIIEYLNEMAKEPKFYQIILTHNFDFYRTVAGRLGIIRENRFHVEKSDKEITLVQEQYQKNPFDTWKKKLATNDEMLIASIPFVRNLAEYCGFEDHYNKLTSLLHLKADTSSIKIGDIEKIYQDILKDNSSLTLESKGRIVIDLIHSLAVRICSEKKQVVELEKKIVLAMAIRLKTEEFLIKQINDDSFVRGIPEYQTKALIGEYKRKFPNEVKKIELANKVNLMTPENIHINSFMYEPILDMSNQHLKQLYLEVCNFDKYGN
jgi:energy-coupling factor transporter ATP-binding protein EcfA2